MIRDAYVRLAHAAGRGADRLGLNEHLARRSGRGAFYVRSLFAIYDVDAMFALETPWWTFRAIDHVDAFLRGRGASARAFEFGAGASTAWLARRCADVHSVEHDPDFADRIAGRLGDAGVTMHVVPPIRASRPAVPSAHRHHAGLDFSDYVSTIDRVGGQFDLVVIDGRAREVALVRSLPHLAAGGMVLFDDAFRRRYRAALTAAPDLKVRWAAGLTPSLPYPSCTALATRRELT